MNQNTGKFLKFKGKRIVMLAKNGTWWIAIKPICEALGVNYNRQFQNLKNNRILNQLFAEQQMVAADDKLRKRSVCQNGSFTDGYLRLNPMLQGYWILKVNVLQYSLMILRFNHWVQNSFESPN